MKYAKILHNDTANGKGVGVSLFVQGCPHHCKGCFNPETWDFKGGKIFTEKELQEIKTSISKNGVLRHFSVLGGEPLCPQNRKTVCKIIKEVRAAFPEITIYLWTGYVLEELIEEDKEVIAEILKNVNFIIDGPFKEELKDLNLFFCGSSNQRLIDTKTFQNAHLFP